MSKKKLWMALVAWVTLAFGAMAHAQGPTVSVTVNSTTGAVSVSPTTVVVVQSDNTVTWTIAANRNYRFASSGGVSIPSSGGYSCVNNATNNQVVCSRTTRSVGAFAYTVNVVPISTAPPAGGTPYGWLQNE
jgi:hypothetical protein